NVRFCVANGIHVVVGTTGLQQPQIDELDGLSGANIFVAPNFSIGGVLTMKFAQLAAPHFGSAEVIEYHHNQKVDAPSGTAMRTASLIADAWRKHGRPSGGEPAPDEKETVAGARGADVDGVHVHGLRLNGRFAHQDVVFGGPGEGLTIRHDSYERTSY